MLCQFAFLAAFLLTSVHAFKFEDIPKEIQEFMPSEVGAFLAGLTDADKAVLKEVVKSKTNLQNEDAMAAAIAAKSPDLGAKVKKIHDVFRKKVDALEPEAQAFAKETIKKYLEIRAKYYADSNPSRAVLKETALSIIKKFQALSDGAKADFKKHLPESGNMFSNEMLLKRLEAFN